MMWRTMFRLYVAVSVGCGRGEDHVFYVVLVCKYSPAGCDLECEVSGFRGLLPTCLSSGGASL
jgi:hypothetical protein